MGNRIGGTWWAGNTSHVPCLPIQATCTHLERVYLRVVQNPFLVLKVVQTRGVFPRASRGSRAPLGVLRKVSVVYGQTVVGFGKCNKYLPRCARRPVRFRGPWLSNKARGPSSAASQVTCRSRVSPRTRQGGVREPPRRRSFQRARRHPHSDSSCFAFRVVFVAAHPRAITAYTASVFPVPTCGFLLFHIPSGDSPCRFSGSRDRNRKQKTHPSHASHALRIPKDLAPASTDDRAGAPRSCASRPGFASPSAYPRRPAPGGTSPVRLGRRTGPRSRGSPSTHRRACHCAGRRRHLLPASRVSRLSFSRTVRLTKTLPKPSTSLRGSSENTSPLPS